MITPGGGARRAGRWLGAGKPAGPKMGRLRYWPGYEGPTPDAIPAVRMSGWTHEIVETVAEYLIAINLANPCDIIFNKSGPYVFTTNLSEDSQMMDHKTILGQMAPSPGVIFISDTGTWVGGDGFMRLTGDNSFIQHIGLYPTHMQSAGAQGRVMHPALGVNIGNDHLTMAWSGDSITGPGGTNSTHSNLLLSQPLAGRFWLGGGVWGKSLRMHGAQRAPASGDGDSGTYYNLGHYNISSPNPSFHGGANPPLLDTFINIINWKAKRGPESPNDPFGIDTDPELTSDLLNSLLFYTGLDVCVKPGCAGEPNDYAIVGPAQTNAEGWDFSTTTLAYTPPGIRNVIPTDQVEAYLIANVGSRPSERNTLDATWIGDYIAGNTGASTTTPGTPPTLAVHTFDWAAIIAAQVPDPQGTKLSGWTNWECFVKKFTDKVQPEAVWEA